MKMNFRLKYMRLLHLTYIWRLVEQMPVTKVSTTSKFFEKYLCTSLFRKYSRIMGKNLFLWCNQFLGMSIKNWHIYHSLTLLWYLSVPSNQIVLYRPKKCPIIQFICFTSPLLQLACTNKLRDYIYKMSTRF